MTVLAKTDDRVQTLLGQMTLDQKIGQMTQPDQRWVNPEQVRDYHIGSVLSGGGSYPGENRPADWVAMNDAFWAASMDDSDGRVPIPIVYGVDAIHGHNSVRGATVFPHNIGLGAARDPELMERIARVTALEVLATGVEWTFAPTLAVVRNDRWGRTYESYSEDPEIVGSYAGPVVRGLQADLGRDAIIACAKHWVGDGGTTGGVDQGETTISEEELRRLHIAPYREALEAGVLTVMASYNSWNGTKAHGHRYLLTDVLKGELGFQGLVVSDWNAIDQLAEDYGTAAARAANAGIDLFMVPERWQEFIAALRNEVEAGRVPMERIDDAVSRILSVKLAYGLFDRPRPAERHWSNDPSFGSAEHRAVAREAVRKSLVLLKNDGALPVAREARIVVAGRNAHNVGHLCGGFTIEWQGTSGNEVVEGTSIWEGIRDACPNAVLSPDGSAAADQPFDVAIVVIGEEPYAEGQGDIREWDESREGLIGPGPGAMEPYGDTLELAALHPEDLATIEAFRDRGIPVVTVLVSGRPLVVNRELDASDAFVAAWLPGSEGGGVAEVLVGDYDFQGRLTFSWPEDPDANPNRGDDDGARFPYGFGLSYAD